MSPIRALSLIAILIALISVRPAMAAEATAAPAADDFSSMIDDAYNGMDGFRQAAAKYYAVGGFLDGQNLSAEINGVEARRAELAFSRNDYATILEIRASGATAPSGLSPVFRDDALQQLNPERLASASSFIEQLIEKNKNNGYTAAFLNAADFEFTLDAAYATFQRALAAFQGRAALGEAAIDKLKSSPETATRSAYITSYIIIAANTLAQNDAVAGYYKKYGALLEKLDNAENIDLLISTYTALVAAHYFTGDAKTAEELSKTLRKLKIFDEVAAAGVVGMFESRIEKPEVLYDMTSDKFMEYADFGKPAGGGGGGSSAPAVTIYNLTISNMAPAQFDELSAALWSLEGYEATGDLSNEKNVQKAEIITKSAVTAAALVAFLNAQKFQSFILTAEPSGETEITAKALGIPREKFDAAAAEFSLVIPPPDSAPATGVLSLIRAMRSPLSAGAGPSAFHELLYDNLEAALAKISGDYKTFSEPRRLCGGSAPAYSRLSGLCLAQFALGSAAAGDRRRALPLLDDAIALFATDPAAASLSRASKENSIALRLASGKEDNPQQAAEQLKQFAKDAVGEELLKLRVTIANSLYASGDYPAAYSAFEDAEQSALGFSGMEQARALILLGKGNCLIMRLRHKDAITEYSAAAKIAENSNAPLLAAAAYSHLATVMLFTGDYTAAEASAQRAAEIADKYENSRLKWQSLYTAARALDAQDKRGEALDKYLAALNRLESATTSAPGAGPAGLSLDAQDVYKYAASLCARMHNPELALQILERGKTAALREQFEQSNVAFHSPAAKKAAEDISNMKTDMAGVENAIQKESSAPQTVESGKEIESRKEQLQDSQRRFIKYVNSLGSADSGLAALYNIEPVELVKVRKKLPPRMAVLYYLLGDTTLYIFHVRADSIGFKEIPVDSQKVEAQVRHYRSLITKPPAEDSGPSTTQQRTLGNTREASAALYALLVKPVAAELQEVGTIAIIPSGVLNFIPYEALAPAEAPDDYLVKKYAIFYLDALSAIEKEPPAAGRANASLYAFGNADETLPGAEREVEAISKQFSKPNIYIRGAATEEKAKEVSDKSGIFHFATHGSLDFKDISKSFITLSPGGGDDGKLTLEEVWGYWWGDTTLVALSACNTATGDLIARGKVLNPAGAFLNAGAPSVLATLWSVDDSATAALMQKFYENLSTMKKADALRAAQLDLLKDPRTAHPYFWAPFTLIGDWR